MYSVAGSGHCQGVWCTQLLGEVTARVYGVLSCWERSLPGCMVSSVAGRGHCQGVCCPQLLGVVIARVYGVLSCWERSLPGCMVNILSCWERSLPECMLFSVAGSGHCQSVCCSQLLGVVTDRVHCLLSCWEWSLPGCMLFSVALLRPQRDRTNINMITQVTYYRTYPRQVTVG